MAGNETTLNYPSWCQVSGNDLFIANVFAGNILVFDKDANGSVAPLRSIAGSVPLGSDYGIFVEGGELFVGSYTTGGPGRVSVFPQGTSGTVAASRVLTGEVNASIGVFVGGGELFTARYYQGQGYVVHDRNASGATAPLRTVTGFNYGFGIWATETEVFVSNYYEVRVYARSATGGGVPLRTFTADGINLIGQLTVNGDEVVVAARTGIYTFAKTANGVVTPLRHITTDAGGSEDLFGACLGN